MCHVYIHCGLIEHFGIQTQSTHVLYFFRTVVFCIVRMKTLTVAALWVSVILCLNSVSEASSALDLLRETAGESFDHYFLPLFIHQNIIYIICSAATVFVFWKCSELGGELALRWMGLWMCVQETAGVLLCGEATFWPGGGHVHAHGRFVGRTFSPQQPNTGSHR